MTAPRPARARGGVGGRLFVAVWPPAEVVEAVRAAVAGLRAARPAGVEALRWTGPEQWHVTLRFLGSADPDEAVAAFRAAAGAAGSGPTAAVLGPATGHFGRRVLHVPVAGLDGLAAAVAAATAAVGEPLEDRPFAGHLTLARARDRRGADLSGLAGAPLAGDWPVSALTLVASRPGPGGSTYRVVDTLPL